MKISVIICTKNRVQELINCIESVIAQSVSPDEIIIVDASDTEKAYLKIKEEFHQESRFKYIRSTFPIGLSADRNKGVRNSSGDIILFLDDDTMLDKDFIKKIVEVFEKDSEKKIGGVMGNVVNADRPKTFRKKLRANLHVLLTRIFLLPIVGNGRFRASGAPTFVLDSTETRDVEFLSGCCMAYRREVFRDLKFDDDFPELYTDDEDVSYRVSQKYRNVYTPYAKLVHLQSPVGSASARRARPYTRAKKTVESRYYLLKKNFPRTVKHTLAFWWSVIGMLVQAMLLRDEQFFKGVISGVSGTKGIGIRLASCNAYPKR
jgi:GT2 family glycosyltransferase